MLKFLINWQTIIDVLKMKEDSRQPLRTITSDDDRMLDEDDRTPTQPPAPPTPIEDTLIFTDEEGAQLEVQESPESSGLEVEISDTEAAELRGEAKAATGQLKKKKKTPKKSNRPGSSGK